MDDFPLDRPELNGSLITLEFGGSGRIHQMWVADPALPEEGQEYQFVLPSIAFGEEFSEDYFPGTILLGARTRLDDPWVLDRTKTASTLEDDDDLRTASFEYDFQLLPELHVTGKFFEVAHPVPQIVWEVKLANVSRHSVEVGELAFPLAFNNLFEGVQGADDKRHPYDGDRVRLHPFIGGHASYLFAQRSNGLPPGLLVFPGDNTSWELWSSVPASLQTSLKWGGIPVIYLFARAAAEREGWSEGMGSTSSLVLEPGDSQVFQTRFVSTGPDGHDAALQMLAICGRPAAKVLPAAVAPRDVGIAVEIGGMSPKRFVSTGRAELETDADEGGGFCFLRPKTPGQHRLSFSDAQGRVSYLNLIFTEPIQTLIRARAAYIASKQVAPQQGTAFPSAIWPMNLLMQAPMSGQDLLGSSFPVLCSLGDALFLAEKNVLYPDAAEIEAVRLYLEAFVAQRLQNPADCSVGSIFVDDASVAVHYGNPAPYTLLFNLFHAMWRIERRFSGSSDASNKNLLQAYATARAMFRGVQVSVRNLNMPGIGQLGALIGDLQGAGLGDQAEELSELAQRAAGSIARIASKNSSEWAWNPTVFEAILWAADVLGDPDLRESTLAVAFAQRGLCPNWWLYGSDQQVFQDPTTGPFTTLGDRGVATLGRTCPSLSASYLSSWGLDYDATSDGEMRLAFGGMIAPWAMVRADGAASMGFCADMASKQHGSNVWSGDSGIGLYAYLRSAGAWVYPSRNLGLFTFGCHFDAEEDGYVIKPWDGVGRGVYLKHIGYDVTCSVGGIKQVSLDVRKRRSTMLIENSSDRLAYAGLQMRGLWGRKFEIEGKSIQSVDGLLSTEVALAPSSVTELTVRTVES